METPIDARVTTGDRAVPDSLRRYGIVVGGVAAGLVLIGLATYTMGTTKVSPSLETLLSAPECDAQPISIVLGQNAEATMNVSRGTRCQIATGLATTSIEEFTVVDPPKHGIVMQRGRTGVVYQSDSDFRGKDSFSFAMRGKSVDSYDGSTGEKSVVRAYVTVK